MKGAVRDFFPPILHFELLLTRDDLKMVSAKNSHGLIVIPDITGYTEFLSQVEITHSRHVIADLMNLLIKGNRLGLSLSEIEGDALLYYRMGPPPPMEEIVEQARHWLREFHLYLKRQKGNIYCHCGACQSLGNLSLKVVCHYGEIGKFNIANREKLFGQDLIVAHRLLKNRLDFREYLMVTDRVFGELGRSVEGSEGFQPHREEYPVLGSIATGVLDLASTVSELPEIPPPWETIPQSDGVFGEGVTINAPIAKVVSMLTNPDEAKKWIPGVREMIFDRGEPIRVGHQHICVFDGVRLDQEITDLHQEGKKFGMSMKINSRIPFLREIYKTTLAEVKDGGVRVDQYFHYTRKRFIGRLFDWLVLPKLKESLRVGGGNLKALLERENSNEDSQTPEKEIAAKIAVETAGVNAASMDTRGAMLEKMPLEKMQPKKMQPKKGQPEKGRLGVGAVECGESPPV